MASNLEKPEVAVVEKEQNTEEPVEDETDSTEAKDSENVTLLDSVMEHEENLSEEEKKKRAIRVRHRYVQDLYRGDAKVCVRTNRGFLSAYAGSDPKWLHQVHGTAIVHADEAAPEAEADGSWTMTPGVVLAIQTADCLPVILTDPEGRIAVALHAGWRGLAAGLLQDGVKLVREKLSDPDTRILAWLAPRIGADDFEVGTDVLDAMKARLPDAASRFKPKAEAGKWLCDLAGLASDALVSEGVKREDIADCGFSTYADPVHFFSYRRDHGETGRHAALVRIEPKAL